MRQLPAAERDADQKSWGNVEVKWHIPLGEEHTLRVWGTISNDLGSAPAALIYNTDPDPNSASSTGFMPGHDIFFIVPRDLADEVSVSTVVQDPLGVIRVFHRPSNLDLDAIKRTIELEAKLVGFVPEE